MSEFRITETGPEEMERVAEMSTRAFNLPDKTLFSRMMTMDPKAATTMRLAGWEGDTMTSSVCVFDRQIRWRDGELRCGGIGNVACLPEHRGKGYAVKLMNHAVELMSERGFELSILFTGIPKYYEKMNYFTWEQSRWSVEPNQVADVAPRGITVRDADIERDAPSLQALHTAFNRGHSGTVVRSEADWGLLRKVYPNDDVISLVAERNGEVVGLTRVMRDMHDGSLRVHELLAADPDAAAVVLHATATRCREMVPDSRVLLTLPAWPVIQQAVSVVFKSAEFANSMGGMIRPLPSGPTETEFRQAAEQGDFFFWAGDRF